MFTPFRSSLAEKRTWEGALCCISTCLHSRSKSFISNENGKSCFPMIGLLSFIKRQLTFYVHVVVQKKPAVKIALVMSKLFHPLSFFLFFFFVSCYGRFCSQHFFLKARRTTVSNTEHASVIIHHFVCSKLAQNKY